MQSRALSGGNPQDKEKARLLDLVTINRGVALLRQVGKHLADAVKWKETSLLFAIST